MRGKNTWSYAPYRPPLWEGADIYISRVVPSERAVYLEWQPTGQRYTVFFRKRGEETFAVAGETQDTAFDILLPDSDTDYEFYVQSEEKKSCIRLARTGKCEGTAVNYLHPDDTAYGFAGSRLASPSMVHLADGTLLASMDVYGGGPNNLTLLFRSEDAGQSWHHLSELYPCCWGKLFLHRGELYMLGCSTGYGDLLIGKSVDGGRSFCAPTVIARGSGGKNGQVGFHRAPQNVLSHNGRLYTSYEWGSWLNAEYCFAAGVLSCDENDDLLVAENWSLSKPRCFDPAWLPEREGIKPTTATIEGTVVADPDGRLMNIMRFESRDALALYYLVNTEEPEAPLDFERVAEFPANRSKFTVRFDGRRYYSVATRYEVGGVRTARGMYPRNLLSLLVSDDLRKWRVAADLIDYRHADMNKHGFQYVDFFFDGEDILYLCRTAMNGAADFHDTNFITFHRIENYKSL